MTNASKDLSSCEEVGRREDIFPLFAMARDKIEKKGDKVTVLASRCRILYISAPLFYNSCQLLKVIRG
jgi:hypothetical protein